MKRAKILLVVISVTAIAAAALAFKAKTYGGIFCTRLIEHGPGICEGSYVGKIDPNQVNPYFYTTTNDPSRCTETYCPSTTFLTDAE
jgi:hypothetical protein